MFNFFKSKKNRTEEEKTAEREEIAADTALISRSTTDAPKDTAETTPDIITSEEIREEVKPMSFASKLRLGLTRTRQNLGRQLSGLFGGGGKIDEELYEELETILLTADTGVNATTQLLEDLRKQVKKKGLTDATELKAALKESLVEMLKPLERPLDTTANNPFVIMITGVNGVGKTTSIGKLAKYFQSQGKSVLLAAGDTFRAAAREQLIAWGERNNVTVIAPDAGVDKKSDPAAVIFDAINAAKARGIDIVLADTAGRLTTQLHLMEEIKKVKRVIGKAIPDAPHEVMLVLDANTGQNAVTQVKAFDEALNVTGLILTKLDGTAKGGVVAAICGQYPHNPPALRFIGIGEGVDDLRPFSASDFVDAMFD
ncbi:MAG: signal recognition particle-docking protein FtsY [Nitrosomonas sp.]|nr:signal recognition particle-docking protein FtsY [Nitrosomonas sp.]MCW5608053.1 signal recognition particle-docking protein FtsY [Nitrosomonas sp.]